MEEEDQLFWLMECAPTASQEAEFPNCPYARESEGLVVRSLSPSPIPSLPTSPVGSPIRMTSLPRTLTTPDRLAADEGDGSRLLEGTGGVEKPSNSSESSDSCVILWSNSREEVELEVVPTTGKIAKGGKRQKLGPLQKWKEVEEEKRRRLIKERAKALLQRSKGQRRSTRLIKEQVKDDGESSKKTCEEPDPKLVALVEELLKQEDVDSFRTAKEKGFKFNNPRYFIN